MKMMLRQSASRSKSWSKGWQQSGAREWHITVSLDWSMRKDMSSWDFMNWQSRDWAMRHMSSFKYESSQI